MRPVSLFRLVSIVQSLQECDHANVDVSDPPFNRHPGETPAMTAQDEADLIAFLKTLNDGYKPEE